MYIFITHTLPSTQICGSIEVAIFSRSGRPLFLRVNYTWVRTIFKKEAIVFGRSPNAASPEDKVSLFWCSKSPIITPELQWASLSKAWICVALDLKKFNNMSWSFSCYLIYPFTFQCAKWKNGILWYTLVGKQKLDQVQVYLIVQS